MEMKILITAPYNDKSRNELEQKIGAVYYRSWKPHGRAYNSEELIGLLKSTGADALITEHDQVTREVIEAFPDLHFIGVCRGTPSNVDLGAARTHGIPVYNTPGRNAQAVAEMFISNVIALMRHTIPGREWLTAEKWEAGAHTSYLEFKGNELAGKTVGLVGFGAIGQLIAKMVQVFACPVLFYDPYIKESFDNCRQVDLDYLFRHSDIVSIHLPVTEETTHMIDRTYISLMKPTALFVNTARAAVVNREDLYNALMDQKIAGAVLDVFDHEPPDERDYDLIHHPRVLATPHIAGATHEVEDHHAEIMNRQLIRDFTIGEE